VPLPSTFDWIFIAFFPYFQSIPEFITRQKQVSADITDGVCTPRGENIEKTPNIIQSLYKTPNYLP
jgi:hypothetical protein